MGKDKEIISVLQQSIVHYLHSHPHAADTLEGITQWWLTESEPGVTPPMIQEALDKLIAGGKISCDVLGGGTMLYFLPQARQTAERLKKWRRFYSAPARKSRS